MQGSEGNYWLDVVVHTVGGETFHVPVETAVKATNISGLDIGTTISPEVVEADASSQFDIQILLENNSGSNETVTRIRHILPAGLSYIADSTGGVTIVGNLRSPAGTAPTAPGLYSSGRSEVGSHLSTHSRSN